MSLLIKGMDMPKLDENAEHLWVPGWIEVGKDGKAIFCTGTHFDPNTIRSYAIEEVPTHGRLIDADKLRNNEYFDVSPQERDLEDSVVYEIIDNAPTIIEAEEQTMSLGQEVKSEIEEMPTCKDCTRIEICTHYVKLLSKSKGIDFDNAIEQYCEKVEADKCEYFQDRSKFVELQCKPGDVLYHYCEELHEILEYTIYCVNVFRENGITYHAEAYDEENAEALSEIGFEPEDIGRDVFLTREEAEQALKELGNETNN